MMTSVEMVVQLLGPEASIKLEPALLVRLCVHRLACSTQCRESSRRGMIDQRQGWDCIHQQQAHPGVSDDISISSTPGLREPSHDVAATFFNIQTWTDNDFDDREHTASAICLRCWCSFTKQELRQHLDDSSCSYEVEQPKSRKMMILYTTLCSGSEPPTWPSQPLKQADPEKSRTRKRRLELSPLCSAASPVTTTPATLTIQPNKDLVKKWRSHEIDQAADRPRRVDESIDYWQ
ncbi:hypothetical protein CEP51_015095 [Fusarium floridanum]|uniref:Uncharacterized protein n=1 Tax=Fusarium floridanum TaxID=1325733 RepID=A0A428PGL8_9HYPO|nr:hypothetical protein CEP51_015095 [Fusarium floridanum]